MKRWTSIAISLCAAALWAPAAWAQFGRDQHTVTVEVAPVSALSVSGGGIALVIDAQQAVAGRADMQVIDATSSLFWRVNGRSKKVTAHTDQQAPQFTLEVAALNPTAGTAAPGGALSTVPRDLLLDIGKTEGSTTIRYTGVARAEEGTGRDQHLITFTITQQ